MWKSKGQRQLNGHAHTRKKVRIDCVENISVRSTRKPNVSTYPPDNTVAVENENIDFVQELCLRITQLQDVGHVNGDSRRECTGRRSCCSSNNGRREVAAAAKCSNIAGGSKQWRSEKKFAGGGCELHSIHKYRLWMKDPFVRDFLLVLPEMVCRLLVFFQTFILNAFFILSSF